MFGSSEKRRAQEAAAKAEADRLCALSIEDLAAEIMPAFGPDGPGARGSGGLNILQVVSYPLEPFPHSARYLPQLRGPVREAVQMLEQAGLIMMQVYETGGGRLSLTRLGQQALAEGSVPQHLARRPSLLP